MSVNIVFRNHTQYFIAQGYMTAMRDAVGDSAGISLREVTPHTWYHPHMVKKTYIQGTITEYRPRQLYLFSKKQLVILHSACR